MTPPAGSAFRKLLVAVDESDPADAPPLGRRAYREPPGRRAFCAASSIRAISTTRPHLRLRPDGTRRSDAEARPRCDRSDARTRWFSADTTSVAIGEDEPARGIITEAERSRAEAIVIGSHGRRGLQRFFLAALPSTSSAIARSRCSCFASRNDDNDAEPRRAARDGAVLRAGL